MLNLKITSFIHDMRNNEITLNDSKKVISHDPQHHHTQPRFSRYWRRPRIDAVRAPEQLFSVVDRLPAHKILSIGVVDGRNIWRNDLKKSLTLLKQVQERLADRLWVTPSCSLLHSSVNLEREEKLSQNIKSWFAFELR